MAVEAQARQAELPPGKANPLGKLAQIFAPGFTSDDIIMPSGRTLECAVSYDGVNGLISIFDKGNPDYRFVALYGQDAAHGPTISFGVNNTHTTSPEAAVEGGKHPDIKAALLIQESIHHFDSVDPDHPVQSIQTSWSDKYIGGPSTNYTQYQESLEAQQAANDGVVTDEMQNKAAKDTWTYSVVQDLGFTQVRDVDESKHNGMVSAYMVRPTEPTPATEPDTTATPDNQQADAAQQPSDATKSDIPNDEPAIDQSPKTVFDAHQPETTEDTTTTTPKPDETFASGANEVSTDTPATPEHQQNKPAAVEDPQPTPPQGPPAQQAPPPPDEHQPTQTVPAPPAEPETDTPKNQDTVPHEDVPTTSTENEQHASFSFRNVHEESITSDTTRYAANEAAAASAEPSVPSPQPDPDPDPVDDHTVDIDPAPSVSPE